jgi:hypothetical protein
MAFIECVTLSLMSSIGVVSDWSAQRGQQRLPNVQQLIGHVTNNCVPVVEQLSAV